MQFPPAGPGLPSTPRASLTATQGHVQAAAALSVGGSGVHLLEGCACLPPLPDACAEGTSEATATRMVSDTASGRWGERSRPGVGPGRTRTRGPLSLHTAWPFIPQRIPNRKGGEKTKAPTVCLASLRPAHIWPQEPWTEPVHTGLSTSSPLSLCGTESQPPARHTATLSKYSDHHVPL